MGQWKHRLSYINTETREAFCTACGRVTISMKDGYWKCNVARKEQRGKNDPQKHREEGARYRKNHPDRKREGFAHLRGDQCEICGSAENLCGDHDHATGKFRGTLCRGCNFGIGFFKDQTTLLSEAIVYLSR